MSRRTPSLNPAMVRARSGLGKDAVIAQRPRFLERLRLGIGNIDALLFQPFQMFFVDLGEIGIAEFVLLGLQHRELVVLEGMARAALARPANQVEIIENAGELIHGESTSGFLFIFGITTGDVLDRGVHGLTDLADNGLGRHVARGRC